MSPGLIVTTGSPHSMHLIGLALKRATGLPVADFRDPWSTMDYLDDFGLGPRARRLIANMERAVVTAATHPATSMPREIGLDNTSKGAVIPNGWDKDDFSVDPHDLPPTRSPCSPLRGFTGPETPRRLGRPGGSGWVEGRRTALGRRSGQHGARGVELDWQGDLNHAQALEAMHTCDALVVVHNNSDSAKASTLERCSSVSPLGFPCSSSDWRMATRKPCAPYGG